MKKFLLMTALILLSILLQAQDFNSSMKEIMLNMKEYTLEMVELMPEEKLDFRPSDSVRSFKGQVQHLITTNHFLLNYFLKYDEKENREAVQKESIALVEDNSSKSDLLVSLNETFDDIIAFFENASESFYKKEYTFGPPEQPLKKDYFATCMLIRDHISHHRAQLIVYLRLNDIKPAQYRGF